jgi:hypothetical protein
MWPHGSSETINPASDKDHSKCVRNESTLNRLSLQPHLAPSAKGTHSDRQYEDSLSPSVVSLPLHSVYAMSAYDESHLIGEHLR